MSLKNVTTSLITSVFVFTLIPSLGWSQETQMTGKQRAIEYIQAGKSFSSSRGVASSQQRGKAKKTQKSKLKKKKPGAKNHELQKSKAKKAKIAKSKTKKKSKIKKTNQKRHHSRG